MGVRIDQVSDRSCIPLAQPVWISALECPRFLGRIAYYVGLRDADYCYRPSSVVCRSVVIVIPAKTAEPIEMSFELWTRAAQRNHVLDGVLIPRGKRQF